MSDHETVCVKVKCFLVATDIVELYISVFKRDIGHTLVFGVWWYLSEYVKWFLFFEKCVPFQVLHVRVFNWEIHDHGTA